MSIIKDVFFGGAEKKAAQAQTDALERGQDFTREGVEQARTDVMNFIPQGQQRAQQGFQQALDVFSQSLPQQAQAFTGGNVAAQQALLAGLPQMQSAILGGQIQPLNIQPFQAQPDFGFANQNIMQALPQAQQPQPQPNASGLLGGSLGSGAISTFDLPSLLSGISPPSLGGGVQRPGFTRQEF